jgi:GT2 family glycosyltransferase
VLCTVRNVARLGSPGARNAGAARASGELLVFLDSDALPTHRHLERHATLHRRAGRVACFGPLRHTTTTEFFRDPGTGEVFPGLEIPESTAARMRRDPASMRITEDDVCNRFASIVDKSAPGAYPHLGWMEELGETQTEARTSPSAWVLMSPQNFSVRRQAFEAVGGFDATLPFCEGWDLMLGLRAAGVPPCRIGDAPIFHIYHHHAFEDFAQTEIRWRAMMAIASKHRQRALVLALLLYAYAGGDPYLPREAGPRDIEHLDALLRVHVADDLGPYSTLLAKHPVLSDIVGDGPRDPAPPPAEVF